MVRVRFAPSPTGLPHVGNIRTALFNWLFARHHGGKFILRIEDTDRERYEPEALDAIMKGLRWLGLDWDEGPDAGGDFGPYFQSERLAIYHDYARKLVAEGKAYYCDCSPERLDEVRAARMEQKLPPMYDRHCRDRKLDSDPTDPTTVVRFKMPLFGKTSFPDELRGEITFDNSTFDDIVLIKSDGFPTYHFAVVCDDHLMQVSHIFRAEEWIPSAGKHALLYAALGWEPPKFVHLPMILGPDRTKLAKRHGATAITEFERQGILPNAMFNFLSLLGWSPKDDTELFTREELISRFDIGGINTAASIFDFEKLSWMNGEYIRKLPIPVLTDYLTHHYTEWGWNWQSMPREKLDAISLAMQERLRVLPDMRELGAFFFNEITDYDEQGVKKNFKLDTAQWLDELAMRFEKLPTWSHDALEETVRVFAEENGVSAGKVIHPVRLAASGMKMGPGLFELLEILGPPTTCRRLRDAAQWIRSNLS